LKKRWMIPPCTYFEVSIRHGCVPSDSGPQFAPHLRSCCVVGVRGETPVSTISTKVATLIPTSSVVRETVRPAIVAWC
jgi:hypothetical protein